VLSPSENTTRKLTNKNRNTDKKKFVGILRWTLSTEFFIYVSIGKHKQNCSGKIRNKKSQIVWWCVTFTDGVTDKINPTVKHILKYADEKNLLVYTNDITNGITVGLKKRQIIRWRDIFTDRMTSKIIDKIILLVIPLVIFNLWPDKRLSSPPPSFLLLYCAYFSATKNHPFPQNSTQFILS